MTSISKIDPYIIAEAGVNHNGSLKIAKSLIFNAKKAGANAIKFQLYDADKMITKYSKLAPYQKKNLKLNISQYELISSLQISKKFLIEIIHYSNEIKIDFMVSVFDEKSLNLINSTKYDNYLKIPSGEITNYFLLNKINLNKNKIILSTGMSNYQEIADALNVLAKCKIYFCKNNKITIKNHNLIERLKKKIVIMHCITEYPADIQYSNLKVINKIKNDFLLPVGFSDHSLRSEVAIASIYSGAIFLEKHITLNKKQKGPDHAASLTPSEFKFMIKKINKAKIIIGNDVKKIQPCEIQNLNIARKFLVAKKDIKKGKIINISDITCKRSSKGISPMEINKVLGKKAKKKFLKDDLIK